MLVRAQTFRATLYVGMKVFGAGFGFINTILFARLLGAREFGLMSLVLAAANLGGTFGALGLPYFITKEVSILREAGRFAGLSQLIRNAQALTFLGSVAYLIVGLAARAVSDNRVTALSSVPVMLLAVGAAFVPVATGNQVRAGIIRGLDHPVAADFPDIVTRPALILIAIGVALLARVSLSATGGMLIQLAGAVVAFVVGGRLVRRYLGRAAAAMAGGGVAESPGSSVRMLPIMRVAPHFLLITLLSTMDVQMTIYLLGFFLGPADVGIFQVAAQPLNVILMGLVAASVSVQARLAASWATSNKEHTQAIVSEATRFSTLVALGVGVPLLVFASFIVRLYGPDYKTAVLLLRILTFGQMMQGITGPIGVVMLMTGYHKELVRFDLPFLLLKVVGISAGIHYFGIVGAAVGEVIYQTAMRLCGVVFVYKKTGLVTTMWGLRHES